MYLLYGTIIFPVLTALLAWILRGKLCHWLLLLGASGHSAITILLCRHNLSNAYVALNTPTAKTLLLLTSLLYFAVSSYLFGYLRREPGSRKSRFILVLCMPLFLAAMSLVLISADYALLWVAVEATTLASAPLILLHRSKESLEAMWKYLLICSTGIALALFGTLLLSLAARYGNELELHSMNIDNFILLRERLNPWWFKAGFVFILAGYGTKMGLVPFHTWLPDAHSEAPGAVSALLSAGLLNCSFYGITRVMTAAPAAAAGNCKNMLFVLGILSLATAAFFIVKQSDFKRMLAYSSIEHMGLIAVIYCVCGMDMAICHMLGHSAIKMSLFLLAGNLLFAWQTRQISKVSALFAVMPRNGVLWFAGLIFICGVPPSPLFFTELEMLRALPLGTAIVIALLLFIVFAGMFNAGVSMVMGNAEKLPSRSLNAEKLWIIPAAGLITALIFAGIFIGVL